MNFLPKKAARYPKAFLFISLILFALALLPAQNLESKLVPGGFEALGSQSNMVSKEMQNRFGQSPNAILAMVQSQSPHARSISEKVQRVLMSNGASSVKILAVKDKRTLLRATFEQSGSNLQTIVPKLQSELNFVGPSRVLLVGQPVLDYELNKAAVNDAFRAELIAAPILLILLVGIYRRLWPILGTLITAVATLTYAKAAGFYFANSMPVTVLFSNIVSMIGLAVSIDYVLFLLTRYSKARADGLGHLQSIEKAYSTAGRTVAYSAAAVALGFLSLFSTSLRPVQSIALGGLIVIGCALIVINTLLPAVMSLTLSKEPLRGFQIQPKVKNHFARTPILRALLGFGLLSLCLLPIGSLKMQSPVASADVLPHSNTVVTALEDIKSTFPALDVYPVNVIIPCQVKCDKVAVTSVERKLKNLPNVKSVTEPVFVGKSCRTITPTSLGKCADPAEAFIQVSSRYSPNDQRTRQLVEQIRQQYPSSGVGGAVATGIDFDKEISKAIPIIGLVIVILGFLVFTAAFRSPILGLATLFVNLLVVGASLGVTSLFLNGLSGGVLNSVTPVVLFAVIFGLTMDYLVYSVHVVQEHWKNPLGSGDQAQVPLQGASKTILGAAALMLVVFLAFLAADLRIVRELGLGLSVGVILDTLVARNVMLPYLLDTYKAFSKRVSTMRKYV